MTPKEKGLELYNLYDNLCRDFTRGVSIKEMAKQCALIAVDEIIIELQECGEVWMKRRIEYWKEVKQEIEKL